MTDADVAALAAIASAKLGAASGNGTDAALVAMRFSSPAVKACLAARAKFGRVKYGGCLPVGWPHAAAGALQEALDLRVYLTADRGSTHAERSMALALCESIAARVARSA